MIKRSAVVDYLLIVGIAAIAAVGVVGFRSLTSPTGCVPRKPCSITLWGEPVHNSTPRTFEAIQQLPKGFKVIKGHE